MNINRIQGFKQDIIYKVMSGRIARIGEDVGGNINIKLRSNIRMIRMESAINRKDLEVIDINE